MALSQLTETMPPTWQPPQTLTSSAPLAAHEVLSWFSEHIQRSPDAATRPRLRRPEDALRLADRLFKQLQTDWPHLLQRFSTTELWRIHQAYLRLPILLLGWQNLRSLPAETNDEKPPTPRESLDQGTRLRDRLLSLAENAYHSLPDAQAEIKRIRAKNPEARNRYDEISKDLADTFALFHKNPFQERENILYPTALLHDAFDLAARLPLLKDNAPVQTTTPSVEQITFGLIEQDYNRLLAVGHYLHFRQPNLSELYPALSPPRENKTNDASSTPPTSENSPASPTSENSPTSTPASDKDPATSC